jgi:hypothetical protein
MYIDNSPDMQERQPIAKRNFDYSLEGPASALAACPAAAPVGSSTSPMATSSGTRYSRSSNICGNKMASISSVLNTSSAFHYVRFHQAHLNMKSPFCPFLLLVVESTEESLEVNVKFVTFNVPAELSFV